MPELVASLVNTRPRFEKYYRQRVRCPECRRPCWRRWFIEPVGVWRFFYIVLECSRCRTFWRYSDG